MGSNAAGPKKFSADSPKMGHLNTPSSKPVESLSTELKESPAIKPEYSPALEVHNRGACGVSFLVVLGVLPCWFILFHMLQL